MLNSISDLPILDQNGQPTQMERNEMLRYNLEHVSRLGFPIRLLQGEATIDDIAIHAILRQRLQQSTVNKRITTLQRLQNHVILIDIHQPDYEQWIKHSDYREQIENAGASALRNEWQAITMLLESYGIPYGKGTTWNYKPPTLPKYHAVNIPLPDTVRTMIKHKYTDDKDMNSISNTSYWQHLCSVYATHQRPANLSLMTLTSTMVLSK